MRTYYLLKSVKDDDYVCGEKYNYYYSSTANPIKFDTLEEVGRYVKKTQSILELITVVESSNYD